MTPQGSLSGSNSELVPFQQTRTIDWANLGNSSINASLNVLARISKANIDGLTIVVGRAIGGLFEWKDIGRERFDQALHSCKGMAGYKNVLWFGFGIEHITHVLTSHRSGSFLRSALRLSDRMLFRVLYCRGNDRDDSGSWGSRETVS